jgi:hypothetical protein
MDQAGFRDDFRNTTMVPKQVIFNQAEPFRQLGRMTKKRPKPLPVVLLLLFFSIVRIIFGNAPKSRVAAFILLARRLVK